MIIDITSRHSFPPWDPYSLARWSDQSFLPSLYARSQILEVAVLLSGSLQTSRSNRHTASPASNIAPHFPSPPELSQENALAPPTGFERVLGGARLPPAAVAEAEYGDVTTAEAVPASGPPLRLMPSSKNRLRPSAGLAVDVAVDVLEKVRVADLGLSTLMPVSLRW
jgi:hypothetical protein